MPQLDPTRTTRNLTQEGLATVSLVDRPDTINFSWLIRLRWWAVLAQVVIILSTALLLKIPLPLFPLFALVLLTLATNLVAFFLRRRLNENVQNWIFFLLLLDILILTGLLHFAGGPANPFSILYLVNLALAVIMLPPLPTTILASAAFCGFGSLFVSNHPIHMHGHLHSLGLNDFQFHMFGMWIAFGIASFAMVYFLYRLKRSLSERDQALQAVREKQATRKNLATLATLATGAAHELSTPLSTVALVAKEIEKKHASGNLEDPLKKDIRLIRSEVDRCRRILDQMANRSGETAGEEWKLVNIYDFVKGVFSQASDRHQAIFEIDESLASAEARLPTDAIRILVQVLFKNASQAKVNGESPGIRLACKSIDNHLSIEVEDNGSGMTEETLSHLGEPFFTTKSPGEGMGLGLFLVRNIVEGLSGTFEIQSRLNKGTHARVSIPLVLSRSQGSFNSQRSAHA